MNKFTKMINLKKVYQYWFPFFRFPFSVAGRRRRTFPMNENGVETGFEAPNIFARGIVMQIFGKGRWVHANFGCEGWRSRENSKRKRE